MKKILFIKMTIYYHLNIDKYTKYIQRLIILINIIYL